MDYWMEKILQTIWLVVHIFIEESAIVFVACFVYFIRLKLEA